VAGDRRPPERLTLVLAANSDSGVFAVHLAARGRTACEPEEVGNRRPAASAPAARCGRLVAKELARALDRAGSISRSRTRRASRDDYQTTQDYSFIRLETGDAFTARPSPSSGRWC
jgi:hypothetical protein